MNRVSRFLMKPRGDRRADMFLRAACAAALLGIPIVAFVPGSVTLVWLAVLSLPANSPLSPILPTAFEPVIMEAAKYERVTLVTLVATAGYMYMEYVNWRVYAWVLSWDRLAGLRTRRSVRWGIDSFAKAPFWTVTVFAFTPLPFWIVRALAILHRYSVRRFMAATLLGRMPRILFYAWFGGLLRVPTPILVAIVVGATAMVVAGRLIRGEPVFTEVAPIDQSDADGGATASVP